MELEYWTMDRAEELADCYNQTYADLPYCYALEPDEFGHGIRHSSGEDKPYAHLAEERLVVGLNRGRTVGFAHVARNIAAKAGDPEDRGSLQTMAIAPGRRAEGQVLLEGAEAYLQKLGARHVEAFQCGYRVYRFAFSALSEHVVQIGALLGINGYTVKGGWRFMAVRDFPPPAVGELGAEFSVRHEPLPHFGPAPNAIYRLYRGETEIGWSEALAGSHFLRVPAMREIGYVGGFFINEKRDQGKGYGRLLMQYTLDQMRRNGFAHAAVHTHVENYRAQLFYQSFGFALVDTTYSYEKAI